MDVPPSIKSRGLKFAERQLQRHGWTEGKGLGRHEDGISEAIKVKVKCDTAGVGHNPAEQFTFHWWDHVFNKTASSISVEPDQDGVKVKKLSEVDSTVSSKKPRKAMLSSNMLYGRFIKSATLTAGGENPVEESSSDSSDSSEDEDSKLDLSSATKLSDEELVRICGGRTAHKGARHGLTMSAKLSRIEEQERVFMEKYGNKEPKRQLSMSTSDVKSTDDSKRNKKNKQREGKVDFEEKNNPSDSEVPKKKKKHKQKEMEKSVEDLPGGLNQEHVSSMKKDTMSLKKKKKSKVPDNLEITEVAEILSEDKNRLFLEEEDPRPAKKKKNRKPVECEESMMVNCHTEDCVQSTKDEDSGQAWDKESENREKAEKSKKRKKKKIKKQEELVKAVEHETCSEEEQVRKPNNKKWRVGDENREESGGRSKRKKKKLVDNEDEAQDEDDKVTKKKKSKHNDRRD